ncbi:N-acetyltransferase [Robertmurraya yapensis]|uniref:N-acetyltransferase n=2 Tax=Bacillaceae TaxID=186817 RepID=A0A3S0LBD5_9BACI|nr:GNAT family protein [Bacillus yapensis]RTR31391.1 N-acetyltransferase [Bacillus yapensis]TKS95615.1 GNAT family N-acetyltransferase [Bacillus yapensis]
MNLNYSSFFNGNLVRLTAPKQGDVDIMALWHEDAEYLRNVDTDIAKVKSIIQIEQEEDRNSSSFYFRVRTIESDELIGFVVIHSVEWNNRAGMLAIGIGDSKFRGKGYGTDTLQLILRYAFHELNLNRVGLDVIEYNERGIRAYEKVGFKLEGRLREAVQRDGKTFDRIVMGILRSEWEELNNI